MRSGEKATRKSNSAVEYVTNSTPRRTAARAQGHAINAVPTKEMLQITNTCQPPSVGFSGCYALLLALEDESGSEERNSGLTGVKRHHKFQYDIRRICGANRAQQLAGAYLWCGDDFGYCTARTPLMEIHEKTDSKSPARQRGTTPLITLTSSRLGAA
ncbi:hypothetical protein EVAR_93045_1 [Eumeta japonica]|uniref:Uncharacterized protein n=1 Tax=Eumeta variegata TaxID=151549 RepID=A0A4C1TEX3_EUMVA|nr:hypothetical protein EVAR_93045_1 [Eumeta japonica]